MAEYLFFDAARAGTNLQQALQLNSAHVSLYKGTFMEEVPEVAPHLFALPNPEFSKWFVSAGWGKSWGVMVETAVSFEECKKHFLNFLNVKTEDGKQHFFRYYDPRVLRVFLPSCDVAQLKEFFGPIDYFIAEDADPAFVLVYSLRNGQLTTNKIAASEFFTTRFGFAKEETTAGAAQASATHAPQVTTEPKKKRRFFMDE